MPRSFRDYARDGGFMPIYPVLYYEFK
jgi:hypothetical protein